MRVGLGCSRFVRHYYGNTFSSSGYMRCFSSPGALQAAYEFSGWYWMMKPSGLPHSEIPGYGCTHLPEAYRSVATSFIGTRRPGIHPVPVVVCGGSNQGFGPPLCAHEQNRVSGIGKTEAETTELPHTPLLPGEASEGLRVAVARQPQETTNLRLLIDVS